MSRTGDEKITNTVCSLLTTGRRGDKWIGVGRFSTLAILRGEVQNAVMDITDNGPKPNAFDIESATTENAAYRRVAWTGKHLQVTLMSIEPGGAIGLEVHHGTDQFLRIDAGKGRAKMGPSKDDLSFQQDVEDGWSIQVPAGTWHDVENTGDEPLRLYVIYAPTHHAQGIVQKTPEDAEKDEEQGRDEPPSWVDEVDDQGEETA